MRGLQALAIACCIGHCGPALADPVTDPLRVPYRAVLAGMGIGSSALSVQVIGNHYRIELDGHLAASESRTARRARARVTGSISRTALAPDHFSATLEHGDGKIRVALGFSNDRLAMVAVLPPPFGGSGRTRPPLSQSRGLIDPLSALVIPAASANLAPLSVCGRTQRVFDGMRRYDIHMFPSRIEPIAVAGRTLSALVCWVELRTAATASRRAERWPQLTPRGQRATVWFAPIAGGKLLAPVRIEADLRFGAFTVEATDANAFATALRAASLR